MTQGFESVQQELQAKHHQLEQELASVRGRASEIQADLERVQEALGALTGTKRKARPARARAKKPATSVEELQIHIAHVREDNPFAAAAELEASVRALVKESGGSLVGFKMLFAEALLTSPGSESTQRTAAASHSGHGHSAHHSSDGSHLS